LLKQLTKTLLETALNQELTEHLGHEQHGRPDPGPGYIRNGTRAKTVLTESTGQVQVQVPRDRDGTFEPQIVRKRQRRPAAPPQDQPRLALEGGLPHLLAAPLGPASTRLTSTNRPSCMRGGPARPGRSRCAPGHTGHHRTTGPDSQTDISPETGHQHNQ
jgi:hypothetical protein